MAACWLHKRFVLACVLLFGFSLAGCAGQQAVPGAKPMPEGKNFSGVWYSKQFDHMHLRQSGETVTGIFTYKEGGRINGKVDGNLLVFDWVQPGSKEHARRTVKGRGYLQLVQQGDTTKLVGEWGYEDQASGAGPWTAQYVRPLEPDDPLTLQALHEKRD